MNWSKNGLTIGNLTIHHGGFFIAAFVLCYCVYHMDIMPLVYFIILLIICGGLYQYLSNKNIV